MKRINFNGRWPINLPDHRADRPINDWWEAQRLSAMHSRVEAILGRQVDDPGLDHTHQCRVLDVGAEEGDFPALFTTWGADVFCVEPNPKAWPWIKRTFEMNEISPAGWYVGMLGSPDQATDARKVMWTHDIHFDGDRDVWPGAAHDDDPTPEHGFHHLSEHAGVDHVMELDVLVSVTGFEPNIITMDVEGGELHALRGAYETLTEFKPELFISVHPEFMYRLYGQKKEQLIDALEIIGYRGQFLCSDHEEHWHFVHRDQPWPWAD